MNTDFTYCMGEDCKLKETCKRHQKEAVGYPGTLGWTYGEYNPKTNDCVLMIKDISR